MTTVSTNNPEREERLNAALAACLEAVENGEAADLGHVCQSGDWDRH